MSNQTISEIQLLANQLNALKSTGPKTEAGKANAKFNARRHGLTGQFYCMSEGDEKAYLAFETNLLSDLKPTGHYESQLAISIVQDQWRLNRSRGVEFNAFGQGHDKFADDLEAPSPNTQAAATMARTWQDEDRRFANIALYETRLHRIIVKNEKRLKELQDERKTLEAAARHDAELILRLALMKGEKLDSKEPIEANGFEFSIPQLIAAINRQEQLREAKFFEKANWSSHVTFPGTALPLPLAA